MSQSESKKVLGMKLRRVMCFTVISLMCGAVIACTHAERAGTTPQGAAVWRIDCPPAGGCDQKARELCGANYMVLDSDQAYNVFVNSYTHQTMVGRRTEMLVACSKPKPRVDAQARRRKAILEAEPAGATPDVRCAYWQEHVERTADVPSTKRLRPWLIRRAKEACAEVQVSEQ